MVRPSTRARWGGLVAVLRARDHQWRLAAPPEGRPGRERLPAGPLVRERRRLNSHQLHRLDGLRVTSTRPRPKRWWPRCGIPTPSCSPARAIGSISGRCRAPRWMSARPPRPAAATRVSAFRPGDEILSIDGKSTRGLVGDAGWKRRCRRAPGTFVTVVVRPQGSDSAGGAAPDPDRGPRPRHVAGHPAGRRRRLRRAAPDQRGRRRRAAPGGGSARWRTG